MKNLDASPGQDSFLDIVANLVGILIILVVIIGAQAATVWKNKPVPEQQLAQLTKIEREIEIRSDHSRNVHAENIELNRKLGYHDRLNKQLTANRHKLLVEIETKKRMLESKKEKLGNKKSIEVDLQTKIDTLQNEIELVRYEFNAVGNLSQPTVKKIDHYPTPIAKTVFSDEIHFQVKNQRVAYVPMPELIDVMKAEWKLKAAKLQQASTISETVGPIDGFRLKYFLNVKSIGRNNPSQYGVDFGGFTLQPSRNLESETVSQALVEDSRLMRRLRNMRPSKTTISFWVYPDSYSELLELRNSLRKKGFQTASWPMEREQKISGSPQGFRTSTN